MRPQLEELESRYAPSTVATAPPPALQPLANITAFFAAGEQVLAGINAAATAAFQQAITLGPRGIALYGPQIVALGEDALTLEQVIVTDYLIQTLAQVGAIDGIQA